jgi:type VI secretion system protein ImpC
LEASGESGLLQAEAAAPAVAEVLEPELEPSPLPCRIPLAEADLLAECGDESINDLPEVHRQAVAAVLARLAGDSFDPSTLTSMMQAFTDAINDQMDAILHEPAFQKVEASWRGLKRLHEQVTPHRQAGVEVDVFHATKDELHDDLRSNETLEKSHIYKLVYSNHYGNQGGKPYGSIVGGFSFGLNEPDRQLVEKFGELARVSHAPFIGAADASLLGVKSFADTAG